MSKAPVVPHFHSESVDEKILSQLGDYLLTHCNQVVRKWVRAVERNPDISSSGHLSYRELVDNLPELCRDLAALLKSPHEHQNLGEVSRVARVHGKSRWDHGYRLKEVIREASIIRRILFHDWVNAFARKVPGFDGKTRRAAEQIIHQALDDVVTDSAEQFVHEEQESVNELSAKLADALAELRQQKKTAEAANKAKDKFLAMLSHELRTPLNPILLWANPTLEESQSDPAIRDGIQMVRRNVELEARLIDDLLDVARITGGKLQLHLELSDAASLLRNAIEMVQAQPARKQVEMRVELAATNHKVEVDRARLQQVFCNVLTNAQKFTPEGGTISIRSSNRGHEKLVFEIIDSGKGIEPGLLPRIFEAFEQGASPGEGLGLGLAISKGIMDAHGGRIHASSKGPGTGATFMIELKTAQNEPATRPAILSF